jgi:hypothetical protein
MHSAAIALHFRENRSKMKKGALLRLETLREGTPSPKNDGFPFFGEGAGDEDLFPSLPDEHDIIKQLPGKKGRLWILHWTR